MNSPTFFLNERWNFVGSSYRHQTSVKRVQPSSICQNQSEYPVACNFFDLRVTCIALSFKLLYLERRAGAIICGKVTNFAKYEHLFDFKKDTLCYF